MLSIQRETLPRLEEQVTLGGKEVEGVPGVGTQGELGGGGDNGRAQLLMWEQGWESK